MNKNSALVFGHGPRSVVARLAKRTSPIDSKPPTRRDSPVSRVLAAFISVTVFYVGQPRSPSRLYTRSKQASKRANVRLVFPPPSALCLCPRVLSSLSRDFSRGVASSFHFTIHLSLSLSRSLSLSLSRFVRATTLDKFFFFFLFLFLSLFFLRRSLCAHRSASPID